MASGAYPSSDVVSWVSKPSAFVAEITSITGSSDIRQFRNGAVMSFKEKQQTPQKT